ncbi:MAG: hypothetical protein CFE23_07460 [Flavobacterium sp. BFFFF1]|uniref:hypothetical protein n=1 Tax=unclassified Flavobacterium TaxID=196869 RepID=UPI000BD0928A|nr:MULTISPECIES: hypothetical protein [unclassified Flavobacterium]OYU80797.1 MAG: hypothetical protein CFE23_07460 [Flavobacterium sp. BFFFF1]
MKLKFLIVKQDLRVSGTSQGICSRSFLSKLRDVYPDSIIDVVYLKEAPTEDQLHLLPVDNIESHVLDLRIPFITKCVNSIYWRLFHKSLNEQYIHKIYAAHLSNIDYARYDHIFIMSSGLNHETILGSKDLPILKKAIVSFHDPYPLYWYSGTNRALSNLDLFRLRQMNDVVSQAKTCISTAALMSDDLQFLYGSKKKFHTLPHQFCEKVFDLSNNSQVVKKNKKVTISYHGAIQFGRNADCLLDAYKELVNENEYYRENTEFILRLRGQDNKRLIAKYAETQNIVVLDTLNFSNSSNEQIHETDIGVILENGPLVCNILVGKAPFLAAYNKPILCISPPKSELRNIVKEEKFIATATDKEEIKQKLAYLIRDRFSSDAPMYPFGDYFSDDNFKKSLNLILSEIGDK